MRLRVRMEIMMKYYLKTVGLVLYVVILLSACSETYDKSMYMSRDEYLSVFREWDGEDKYPQAMPDNPWILDLTWYADEDWCHELFSEYTLPNGEAFKIGRMYMLNKRTMTAELFVDVNAHRYAYMYEYIFMVLDGTRAVLVEYDTKKMYDLFTTDSVVEWVSTDGQAVYYLVNESIWRFFPGDGTNEKLLSFPRIEDFYVLSNYELIWYSPTEEYLEFMENLDEERRNDPNLDYLLGRHGLLGPGYYYCDLRNGVIIEQEPYDPTGQADSDPPWYEPYRNKE